MLVEKGQQVDTLLLVTRVANFQGTKTQVDWSDSYKYLVPNEGMESKKLNGNLYECRNPFNSLAT